MILLPSPVIEVVATTEEGLIAQAQGGSREAAAELFRRHWPGVWKAAYSVVGRRALADDVAQEAFVRGFTSLERFDRTRALAPWLNRIAVNAALDMLRQERRISTDVDALSDADIWFVDASGADEVVAHLQKLAPSKRIVLTLRFWLDYSIGEIAEALEIPPGTVMSRLHRGLSELRTQMEATHVE
jgi:RNA polymerase sigma-70 factor, ECF subfamily